MSRKAVVATLVFALLFPLAMLLPSTTLAAAKYSIRAGHTEAADSPLHMGWQTFKAYVEGASGGDIEIKIFPAGQLGSHMEILEQVKAGALQIGQGDEAVPGEFFRPMDLLAAPFLFNNEQEALRFFDGSFFGSVANDMAKRTGLRILSVAPLGFRNFTNNVRRSNPSRT
jgi:C4-dicarboxylate-binding protein DctP